MRTFLKDRDGHWTREEMPELSMWAGKHFSGVLWQPIILWAVPERKGPWSEKSGDSTPCHSMSHNSLDILKILRSPAVKNNLSRGAWVVQSVQRLTLDFGSGHDVTVRGIEPHIRLHTDSREPAWDSLSPSPSLSVPLPMVLSLSLKINKLTEKKS